LLSGTILDSRLWFSSIAALHKGSTWRSRYFRRVLCDEEHDLHVIKLMAREEEPIDGALAGNLVFGQRPSQDNDN
jgi:hypothetical protein